MTRLRGLPVQLFLFTILPLTLLLAGIAFGGLTLHQRAMRQMVGERDERATRAAAAALEEQLQRRAAAVTNLALHVAHVAPTTAIADTASFSDDFISLAVFGSDGALRASDNTDFWAGLGTGFLSKTPDSGGFLPLITHTVSGETFSLAVAPTQEGGIAAGAFDPAVIARDVLGRVVRPGDHSVAYLVAPDGTLLYQTGPGDHTAPITNHPGVAEALRGEMGTSFVNVQGDGLLWTKPLPNGRKVVPYETWLRLNHHLATLNLLDQFQAEMRSISETAPRAEKEN